MTTTITGVVANGVIVPSSILPEGTRVEIHLIAVDAELQEEFDGWDRAGAGTIEMIEEMAERMEAHEKR